MKIHNTISGKILGVFILGLILSISNHAYAANYYLDATLGVDTNIGTTEQTAWKTLTKLNAVIAANTITAGDTVYLKRGETFSGNLVLKFSGTNGAPITIDSYGTGNKPVINASGSLHGVDIRNNLSYITIKNLRVINSSNDGVFLFNSGSNITIDNVEISNTGVAIPIASGNFSNITISNVTASSNSSHGVYLNGYTSVSNLSITSSSFSNTTGVGNGVYLYNSTTGTTSNITISNTTTNSVSRGFYLIGVSNVTISGSTSNNNILNGIDLTSASNITISGATANNNGSSGISVGATSSNVSISNSTFNDNISNGVSFATSGTDGLVANTQASRNGNDGFNIHGTWSNVVFDNCVADNNGIDGLGADGDGFSFHGNTTGTIKNSFATNNKKSAVAHVGAAQVKMEYNVFRHDTLSTLRLVTLLDTGTYTLNNNVIYSGSTTPFGAAISIGPAVNFSGRNNIVYGFATGINATSGTTGIQSEDYNIYHSGNPAVTIIPVTNIALGSRSISANPLFLNASNTFTQANDFKLQSTSPAIDAGVIVSGLTLDRIGTAVPLGVSPDIGVFEYIDITAPTLISRVVNPSPISATINWTTDEKSSSSIEYGTTISYGATTTPIDLSPRVTNHSVTLSNLTLCTEYYFRIISTDAQNNTVTGIQDRFMTNGCSSSGGGSLRAISAIGTKTEVAVSTPASCTSYGIITSTVKLGSKNKQDIKGVQQALNQLKITTPLLTEDGLLGPKTITAIKLAQKKFNIKQDGMWGKQTQLIYDKWTYTTCI